MRAYIRAASGAKMAKIRMWETDNSALLQLDGGAGGGELQAYRTLSQRVRVMRPAPPPDVGPPPSPAPSEGLGGAAVGGRAASPVPPEATPHGGAVRAALLAAARSRMPGKPRAAALPAAAAGSGGCSGGGGGAFGGSTSGAPAAAGGGGRGGEADGARLPAQWQPRGVLVSQLRAHAEGVRQLVLCPEGGLFFSRGRWPTPPPAPPCELGCLVQPPCCLG